MRKPFLFLFISLLLSSCGSVPQSSSISSSKQSISSEISSSSTSLPSSSSSSLSSSSSSTKKEETGLKFQTFTGKFTYGENNALTSSSNNLSLITNKTFGIGTIKMNMKANGSGKTGIIFLAASYPTTYYFAGIETSQGNRLILEKREGSSTSEIGASYITAGYSQTSTNEIKIVYDSGKIQVFYNNCLFISRTDSNPLTGDRVGLLSYNSGSFYSDISIVQEKDFKPVDTLIIGHSYMELWSDYKSDLSRYSDIHNIGIGGTSSVDWKGHVNEVVDYAPKKLIFMIGINDVSWNSASNIKDNIAYLVDNVLSALPECQVCIVSINQCVTHTDYKSTIKETNRLLWNYVYQTPRTYYGNVDNAFLSSDGTPDPSCFVDGLHPSKASYKVIAQAIYDAFDGKEQPEEPKTIQTTLIIGHSYMDNWKSQCESDLSNYENVTNIGIGATNSLQWAGKVDEIVGYNPVKLIYMIGINDIPHDVTNRTLYEQVRYLFISVHEKLPACQMCLLSVNDVPRFHDDYKDAIDEANNYYKKIAVDLDYVYYGDLDDAFLNDDGTPDENMFMEGGSDGLHPKLEHYDVIVKAIDDAFNNVNQPAEEDVKVKVDDYAYDLNSGKAFADELSNDCSSSYWQFDDADITMLDNGNASSSSAYESFSIAFEFSAMGPNNPFFSNKAEIGMLFGGEFKEGKYTGYALNIGKEWVEIVYINGSSSYDCSFVDGININGIKTKLRLTVNNKVASITYGDEVKAANMYSGGSSCALPSYKEGKVGLFNATGKQCSVSVYEVKQIVSENKISSFLTDLSTSENKSSSNDWTVNAEGKTVTTTSNNGYLLSEGEYEDFRIGFSVNASKSENPFFSHKAQEGLFLGGSITEGKYSGYVINFCADWIEVLYCNGNDNTSTFIDGWCLSKPFGQTIWFNVSGGVATATDSSGNAIASASYLGKSSISMDNYKKGSLGIVSFDGETSAYTFEGLYIL